MNNIAAVILAAGQGSRIGCPKWQLPLENGTFFSSIVEKILQAGISQIICVASAASIPKDKRVKIVINPNPEHGMFSSIYWGVQAISEVIGYLIMPVDHPYVKVSTLSKLLQEFLQHSNKIIKPIFHNQAGHPIIIPKTIAQKIPNDIYPGGLRKFLLEKNAEWFNIKVNDPGILKNINTAEDLK